MSCASEVPYRTPITKVESAAMAASVVQAKTQIEPAKPRPVPGLNQPVQQQAVKSEPPTAQPTTPMASQPTVPTGAQNSKSSVQLSWQDNSKDEISFVIERCDQILRDFQSKSMAAKCRGTWKVVGTVSANVTSYTDDTVLANQTYLYRVKATNKFGSSGYTAEAVITAPVK